MSDGAWPTFGPRPTVGQNVLMTFWLRFALAQNVWVGFADRATARARACAVSGGGDAARGAGSWGRACLGPAGGRVCLVALRIRAAGLREARRACGGQGAAEPRAGPAFWGGAGPCRLYRDGAWCGGAVQFKRRRCKFLRNSETQYIFLTFDWLFSGNPPKPYPQTFVWSFLTDFANCVVC